MIFYGNITKSIKSKLQYFCNMHMKFFNARPKTSILRIGALWLLIISAILSSCDMIDPGSSESATEGFVDQDMLDGFPVASFTPPATATPHPTRTPPTTPTSTARPTRQPTSLPTTSTRSQSNTRTPSNGNESPRDCANPTISRTQMRVGIEGHVFWGEVHFFPTLGNDRFYTLVSGIDFIVVGGGRCARPYNTATEYYMWQVELTSGTLTGQVGWIAEEVDRQGRRSIAP